MNHLLCGITKKKSPQLSISIFVHKRNGYYSQQWFKCPLIGVLMYQRRMQHIVLHVKCRGESVSG